MKSLLKKIDLKLLSLLSLNPRLLAVSDFFPLFHTIGPHKVKITYVSPSLLTQVYNSKTQYKLIAWNEHLDIIFDSTFKANNSINCFDITTIMESVNVAPCNGFFAIFQYHDQLDYPEETLFTAVERGYIVISSIDDCISAISHGNKETVGLHKNKKLIPLGGINQQNLSSLNTVNSDGLALVSEIKKKPANIFSRLF